MLGVASDITWWPLVAVALVLVVVFVIRTVSSIRLIAHRPSASVGALRLHDRAAGALARAVAVVAWMLLVVVSSWWRRDSGAIVDESGVAIVAVVTVFTLMLIERRWPVPGGTVRSASLQRRSLIEVLPRGGLVILGVGLLLALGLTIACGVISQFPSDPVVAASSGSGHGSPWPGWGWALHLWIGIAVIAAVAAWAVALLLRRPALAGFDRAVDLAYRRAGVDRILRVLSCYCFIAASYVLNEVKNAILPDYQFGLVLDWLSAGLMLAGLVSIELFRTRPPGESGARGPSVRVVATP